MFFLSLTIENKLKLFEKPKTQGTEPLPCNKRANKP